MELVYAKGPQSYSPTEVALYDPLSDRLEVIATLSPYPGQHNNGPYHAIDWAKVAIANGLDFDRIVTGAANVLDFWWQ